MISFDTNLLVYHFNRHAAQHAAATEFLAAMSGRDDVALCELVLIETYVLLRNPAVFEQPASARQAVASLAPFRSHPRWRLVDYPGTRAVADAMWTLAAEPGLARRRVFDVRLALTLRHHGVTAFATANVGDFDGLGFERVWDPLVG